MNNQKDLEWKVTCDLKIIMKNSEDAQIFINSFSPEIDTIPKKRVSLAFTKEGNIIYFKINALDITAFRASLNSLLQFGAVVDKVVDYIDGSSSNSENDEEEE